MNTEEIIEEIDNLVEQIDRQKLSVFKTTFDEKRKIDISAVGHIIDSFSELSALSAYTPVKLSLPRTIQDDIDSITDLLARYNNFRAQYRLYAKKVEIELRRGGTLVELQEDDIEEIQKLIDNTRSKISSATFLDEGHKGRLLSRLEVLQSEIHKVRSDMDRALAGLVEVGDAMGKFGKKAKPLVDAFERISKIFNNRRDEPLSLPSPPKQLEDKRDLTEE